MGKTFEQCRRDPPHTIYVRGLVDNHPFLIMRGGWSLTAYIGVDERSPLYGMDNDEAGIECHGGLTFGQAGDGKPWEEGYWWFGWDYGHYGDAPMVDVEFIELRHGMRWTPDMVEKEVIEVSIRITAMEMRLRASLHSYEN